MKTKKKLLKAQLIFILSPTFSETISQCFLLLYM